MPNEYELWGQKLEQYCNKYGIPVQHFFAILNDQKVIPMLRGKGMEYDLYLTLQSTLDPAAWDIRKLNPNPQRGRLDADLEVIHRRTGIRLVVESKSSVRGSLKAGTKRQKTHVPHFNVKSHRSRSNKKLATNDRYPADAFDVLMSTPLNALFAEGTIGENLELLSDPELIQLLEEHYGVTGEAALRAAAASDWRFVLPPAIAENGFIPRTPVVYLQDDQHWRPLDELESQLTEVVQQRWDEQRRAGRS